VWKTLRIVTLLLVLAGVATQTWLDRATTTDWDDTLWVGIFPVSADGSAVSESYIRSIDRSEFASIEAFFSSEAVVNELPPILEPGSSALQSAWWSLKVRWYARRISDVPGRIPSQIRIFVLYHDPAAHDVLPHSLGLQKGLVGVVNAFADAEMRGSNAIVIAHEVMHTLGATDKYDPETDAPRFPDGFAEPSLAPRYPQRFAEIMAGRRPITEEVQELPHSLREVLIGDATAVEIGWPAP
jgi:hypothetical protein